MSQVVFVCRKCEHNLFVTPDRKSWITKLVDYDCPNCGEEGFELWIFGGFGKFEDWEGPTL